MTAIKAVHIVSVNMWLLLFVLFDYFSSLLNYPCKAQCCNIHIFFSMAVSKADK